jgi:glycerophosphoryl diester phosphodiesterase
VISPVEKILKLERPLIVAHRGYSAVSPENTFPAFRHALSAEADVIELDYHTSSDGVPMVIHDATLDRTTNARSLWKRKRIRVASKTVEEIRGLDAGSWFHGKFAGAKVPPLSDALSFLCGSGAVVMVEHKSGDAETLARLLRHGRWINKVIVHSFDWKFLSELHELLPEQILGALGPACRLVNGRKPASLRSQQLNVSWLNDLQKSGARVCTWSRKVSRSAVEAAHSRGLKVWVYTIDDRDAAQRLHSLGVDGIITNAAGHAVRWFS